MKAYILIALILSATVVGCSKESINQDSEAQNTVINNRQTTGASANDLLSDETFTSMVIEIVYVNGFEPTQQSINNFVSFLESRTFKPNGITIEKRAIPSPGKETFSIDDIADIEKEERIHYNTDTKIAVWALFIDGKSENDSSNTVTLGTAYWNTSFVIYEETLKNLTGGPFNPDQTMVETTVINHEFGHILGLTNLGSNMQAPHEDEEHPKHCNNENCLMYWATESGANLSNMLNMSSAPQLDSQCLADLKANGGK